MTYLILLIRVHAIKWASQTHRAFNAVRVEQRSFWTWSFIYSTVNLVLQIVTTWICRHTVYGERLLKYSHLNKAACCCFVTDSSLMKILKRTCNSIYLQSFYLKMLDNFPPWNFVSIKCVKSVPCTNCKFSNSLLSLPFSNQQTLLITSQCLIAQIFLKLFIYFAFSTQQWSTFK